jgi:hypothetical protein
MDERDAWVDRQRRQQSGARWAFLIVMVAAGVWYAAAAVSQNWPAITHALFGWL